MNVSTGSEQLLINSFPNLTPQQFSNDTALPTWIPANTISERDVAARLPRCILALPALATPMERRFFSATHLEPYLQSAQTAMVRYTAMGQAFRCSLTESHPGFPASTVGHVRHETW